MNDKKVIGSHFCTLYELKNYADLGGRYLPQLILLSLIH